MPFELDVPGSGRFPVGKVVGIGKNYADHVREMAGTLWSGANVDRAPKKDPVLFLKPASSLLADGGEVVVPPGVGDVHHEVELAAVIGRTARHVDEASALDHVAGYAVALDLTARDVQAAAKREGRPWTLAKGLDTFCPISAVASATDIPDPQAVTLRLTVNGETRQEGSTQDMIHSVAAQVAFVSRWMTLEPGDVILTGTPAGVGPVKPGDRLEAVAEGVGTLGVTVTAGSP